MIDLNDLEIINLYLMLSEKEQLLGQLDSAMLKLERYIFERYNVEEIEAYQSTYKSKGKL